MIVWLKIEGIKVSSQCYNHFSKKKRKSVLNSFLINVNLLSNSSNNCQETWITLKIFAKLAHNKMLKSYSGKMKMFDRSINFDLSKSGHLESHLTNVQYKVKIFRTLPLKVPDSSLGHLKETKTNRNFTCSVESCRPVWLVSSY